VTDIRYVPLYKVLETTGIDLQNGGGVPEIRRFQDHYTEYKIVVYSGLNCEDIILQGEVTSEKKGQSAVRRS